MKTRDDSWQHSIIARPFCKLRSIATSRIFRTLAWIALAAAALLTLRALLADGLFREPLWTPDALARLAAASAIYWLAAGLLLLFRPRWFFPALAIFVFLYSEQWCARFFSVFAPAAVLYFLGSCFFLGRVVFRQLDALLATLTGLAVWIFLISIAAHFPVNTPAVYAIAFAIPYLLHPTRPKISLPAANFGHALLVYVLLLHWLVALKPEAGADALAMHLAIPAMIAHNARFAFDFQFYTWALMPMGGDFAYTAVYLLGGEAAARLLNFALLAILAGLIYRTALRWLPPNRAAVAAALFASTPLVQLVTGSLFVENVWAAFVTGSVLALWTGEVAAGAVLLGAAFSTKLGTSAYLVPAIILAAIALRKTEHARPRALQSAALLIVFAAPPYLYAFAKTRNPIFPFANATFRSPYFETAASLADVRYHENHDWNALYNLTFHSQNFLEAQPGAFGFQWFLLLVPLLLLLNRKSPRALVATSLAAAILTYLTLPNLRYLYPALPLLSIAFAALFAEIPALLALPILALNLWFLPSSSSLHHDFAVFTRRQFETYLNNSAPQRKLIDVLNRIAPGQTVALFGGDPIAGLHAPAYTDQWHTYRFWKQILAAHDPAEVAALVHADGIRYVIAPPNPEILVEQHFLEQWTASTGYISAGWELRRVVDTAIVKPREFVPLPPGSYDDMDTRIDYTGSWLHDRQFAAAANHSLTYSDHPGDTVRFYFIGRSITYVFTKAVNRGIAEVRIDNQPRPPIDEYSRQIEWQQRVVFSGLDSGPHNIELRVSGRKNPESTGHFLDVDQFQVEK